jgi:outer membrane protein OmpA-like peptidoglycan-associated protein
MHTEPSLRRALFIFIVFTAAIFCSEQVSAQIDLKLDYGQRFSIVEREDLRVYEGGSYRGFLFREKRGYFRAADAGSSAAGGDADGSVPRYEGEIYVVGEMKREAKLQEKPVDNVYEVSFRLRGNGYMQTEEGTYLLRKGFPRFPGESVNPGDSWSSEGEERYLTAGGAVVRSGFSCRYTYRGEDVYLQRPVRIVDFQYVFGGLSGGFGSSGGSGGAGAKVGGKVEGSLIIFTDGKGGYFVRERIDRRIERGGRQVRETGFRLTWSTGIAPAQLDSLEQRIVGVLGGGSGEPGSGGPGSGNSGSGGGPGSGGTRGNGSGAATGSETGEPGTSDAGTDAGRGETGAGEGGPGTDTASSAGSAGGDEPEGISVERREEGLVLNLPAIHFVPDQAQILPEERGRLDKLAELLKLAPDSTFLVKGHTADVGTRKSQYELSVERAKTIIDEMAARGLRRDDFLYRGLGGDEPVASNETEAGRARNRRVEVIILD